MRKKIVAGNWKMNLNFIEAMALADAVTAGVSEDQRISVILAPPFIYLHEIVNLVKDHPSIAVAAQDCFDKNSGAFTGEVAASMIESIGVKYVIIGHSERRKYFHDDNVLLAKKNNAVLEHGLLPIYCCGETRDQRNSKKHFEIVREQIEVGLFQLDKNKLKKCVVAYEPVWAIGSGEHAKPEQAQEMHLFIRKMINEKYGEEIALDMSILYGGSLTPENAKELFSCPDVDGGLVGSASLDADKFIRIVQEMEKLAK